MSSTSAGIEIREAVWPDDEAVAEFLLRGYATYLAAGVRGSAGICLTGFDDELADAARRWSLPRGALLLAFVADEPSGCVGLKLRPDHASTTCEMKRLWVREAARGRGLGKLLVEAAISWCCQHGLTTLLLDTVPAAMPEAVALYRWAGFVQSERHNTNDVAGLLFMQKHLCCEEQHEG